MTALDFRILGPLEVWRDGERVAIGAPRQRALLGYLLLHANEPIPRDTLIEQLWGEEAPATARASLHNHVHALREHLGPDVLAFESGAYLMRVERGQLDLDRFERLAAEARQAEPTQRAAKLRDALACWRGTPLVEFPTEPFAQDEINRLEEERLTALEDRLDADLELGRHAELVAELESLVEHSPQRERLWAQLMLALYRAGRQADALAAYRRAHDRFVTDLGIEPGVVLRELQHAILVQDPALDDPAGRVGSTLERIAAILPKSPRERAESLYEFGVSLMRLGETRQAVSTLGGAQRLAAATGEHSVEDRARLYLSYLSVWTEGKSLRAHLDEAELASHRFHSRGDDIGLAVALRQRSQMTMWSGRAEEGTQLVIAAAEAAARSGDDSMETSCRALLPDFFTTGPMPVEEAIVRCEALAAEVSDEPRFRAQVPGALAELHAQAGRFDVARRCGREATAAAKQSALAMHLLGAMSCCAAAELTAGNTAAAIDHFRSAYALRETEGDHLLVPEVAAGLASALAIAGVLGEAEALARRARALVGPDSFSTEVLWRRALALVAAHEGRVPEAILLADEARARTAASDWLSFHGETLETVAAVRRLAGDAPGAVAALEEGLAVYERKGNVARAVIVRRELAAASSS